MKKGQWVLILISLLVLTFIIVCKVFDSRFAEAVIDYFAFFAGIFLMAEGVIRIITSPSAPLALQLSRALRAVIGVSVFTIHLLQFMRY